MLRVEISCLIDRATNFPKANGWPEERVVASSDNFQNGRQDCNFTCDSRRKRGKWCDL